MGNLYSKTLSNEVSTETSTEPVPLDQSFSSHVNDIAIHYILKQNVIDLLRLTDKEYADNLIVLVSNVFDKNLTHEEIGLLNSHIESETIQEAILDLIPSNETIKKKMLLNISKYYIKIMMIYSAIVSTLDPQYMYEDEKGEKQVFYLKDVQQLKKIPKNVSPVLQQLTNPMNLCKRRVSILKNKLDDTEDDVYILNPGEKVCSTEGKRTLHDEVGIKELDLLYYDIFDYGQKSWKSRSPEMEIKYNNDLTLFYQTFTGKQERPSHVKSFKDIELLDLRSLTYCTDPLFTQEFTVPKTNPYIKRYVEEIKQIEEETRLYRETLNAQLNILFHMNTKNDATTYSINPKLTMKVILETEEETREIIRALYTDCERRFVNALLLFEKIYNEQTKNLNQQQYNQIQKRNVINTNRNKIEDDVEIEEEPLYNKALYVNKPIGLPEYYGEPALEPQPQEPPQEPPQEFQEKQEPEPDVQKDNPFNTGLNVGLPRESVQEPLNKPENKPETKPENKPINPSTSSWLSGITDTFSRLSGPSKEEPKKVPETNTFGAIEKEDNPSKPIEKDLFGNTKEPVAPVEKDIFGYPVVPKVEPVTEPVTEPVSQPTNKPVQAPSVDLFGYPVAPVPNQNNKRETNIVLKPFTLNPIEKPMNKNENVWSSPTLPEPAAPVPDAPVPAAPVPAAPVPAAPVPVPASNNMNNSMRKPMVQENSVNRPNLNRKENKDNKDKEAKPRNMFGEII